MYQDLMKLPIFGITANSDIGEIISADVRYEGYILRQEREIESLKNNSKLKIPKDIDYSSIKGMSNEAIERFTNAMPENIGQAMNIRGINSSAVSLLKIHIKKNIKVDST